MDYAIGFLGLLALGFILGSVVYRIKTEFIFWRNSKNLSPKEKAIIKDFYNNKTDVLSILPNMIVASLQSKNILIHKDYQRVENVAYHYYELNPIAKKYLTLKAVV